MRSLVLSTVRPVAVALAVLLAVPPAFARVVVCESRDYRYRYCPVSTCGDVQLRNERSRFLDAWIRHYQDAGWRAEKRKYWFESFAWEDQL